MSAYHEHVLAAAKHTEHAEALLDKAADPEEPYMWAAVLVGRAQTHTMLAAAHLGLAREVGE
jgi:hypothetical protein